MITQQTTLFDFVIVGAGITGCTLAERIANDLNYRVLMIDKRSHIGGNVYDEYNQDGILIQKYGPHIFHTKLKTVWDYLSRFTAWRHYQHQVLTFVDGQYVPFPINLDTINTLFHTSYTTTNIQDFYDKAGLKTISPANAEEGVTAKIGPELFEKFFKHYTKKQWNLWPHELDAEVINRIPIRQNRDPRYFADRYQGIPLHGFTRMFENMLKSKNISLLLNTDFATVKKLFNPRTLIYTGPVDEYFDFCFGKLAYRSLRLEFETLDQNTFQPVATVNYPNDYDFTRITEFKKLTGQRHPKTTILREYPTAEGAPFYPVPTRENQNLYEKYAEVAAKEAGVLFAGRLGKYRYLNMDMAVKEALDLYARLKNGKEEIRT
jgi:UDP-galactopyranose mutase